MSNAISHPRHYCSHSSNVEAIDIKEELPSNLGDALKYAWRLGMKDAEAQERGKCCWYLRREAQRLNNGQPHFAFALSSATIALASQVNAHETESSPLGQILQLVLTGGYNSPASLLRVAAWIEMGAK